jgi:hypothetical protein
VASVPCGVANDSLGLTLAHADKTLNTYDLVSKLIAFHEVAHAYALQLTSTQDVSAGRRRGFELIADLLATTWIYNQYGPQHA